MNRLAIRVPATSANVGTGYDVLGVALNLHNEFVIETGGAGFELRSDQPVSDELRSICKAMVDVCSAKLFECAKTEPQPFSLSMTNHVPIARGLGSSATLRLAVLEGLNRLLKLGVASGDIVKWTAELEGCADNAAAAYYGGFTASGVVKNRLHAYKVDLPAELDFVAVSPQVEVETDKARVIFKNEISREDAIHNLTHGILIAMAVSQGDWERVGDLMDDRLHQPQRQANIPALKPLYDVIAAAREAGALGAYLSGSGSTMMAWTLKDKEQVAAAMEEAIRAYGLEYETRLLKSDNKGIVCQ